MTDHDRSEKNLRDIKQAINSDLKYDVIDPIVSGNIAFVYDSKSVSDEISKLGQVTGSMKPPGLSVTTIKSDRCTLSVRPHADSKGSQLKFEKNEVIYGPIGVNVGDEKENGNDDEKEANDNGDGMKVVEIESVDGDMVISGLRAETEYGFRVRARYEQIGFTNYSNLVTITTLKMGITLKWNRNRHGNGLVFVNDQRVKYPSTRCIALADYVVRREEHETFEWTVQVHQWSKHTWIGFVNADSVDSMNLNYFLGSDQANQCSVGQSLGQTSLSVYGNCKASSIQKTIPSTKVGDVFKFVVDFQRNQVTVYLNDKSLGVYWQNVYDALIPAASNNTAPAEYTISGFITQ